MAELQLLNILLVCPKTKGIGGWDPILDILLRD